MSGLFGGGNADQSQSQTDNTLGTIRFQTSAYGQCISVVFGTTRLTGNLIWFGDFYWTNAQPGSGGGKGGGGSTTGGGTGQQYYASYAYGICEGPITGIQQVWVGSNLKPTATAANFTVFTGAYPQTAWTHLSTGHPTQALGYSGTAYTAKAAGYLGGSANLPNLSWEVQGFLTSPNLIKGWNNQTSDPKYETLGALGSIIESAINTSGGGEAYTNAFKLTVGRQYAVSCNLQLNSGTAPLIYTGTAAGSSNGSVNQRLVSGGNVIVFTATANDKVLTIQNLSGETSNFGGTFNINESWAVASNGGLPDANPADIIESIITNPYWGLGVSPSLVDVVDYRNYCLAQGLLLSPAYTSQKSVQSILNDICEMTNSQMVWHDGSILKFVPYGDVALSGNGATWTPNLTPIYYLTDNDFLAKDGEDPVQVTRSTPADSFNTLKIEYYDRLNEYNVTTRTLFDQSAVDLYGVRPGNTKTWHDITTAGTAIAAGRLMLQRNAYLKNTYKFQLGWNYCLLEPMDIVALTDSALGMSQYPVRVTEVEEDEDGALTITAEDILQGMGSVNPYESTIWQATLGYTTPQDEPPGNCLPPYMFNAPAYFMTTTIGKEFWLASAGRDAYWFGFDACISFDGITYTRYAIIMGQSPYGFLTTALPSGSDPDTTDSFGVQLNGIGAYPLSSQSQAQADADNDLWLIDSELINVTTVTLTGPNAYTASAYIRRGQGNTSISAHNIGVFFADLGQADPNYVNPQFAIFPYNANQSGKTVYIKLVSFNKYGTRQDITQIQPYIYVLP